MEIKLSVWVNTIATGTKLRTLVLTEQDLEEYTKRKMEEQFDGVQEIEFADIEFKP